MTRGPTRLAFNKTVSDLGSPYSEALGPSSVVWFSSSAALLQLPVGQLVLEDYCPRPVAQRDVELLILFASRWLARWNQPWVFSKHNGVSAGELEPNAHRHWQQPQTSQAGGVGGCPECASTPAPTQNAGRTLHEV